MSDIQTQTPPETLETPQEQSGAPSQSRPPRDGARKEHGDRPRGPRRDGMREEEKEFKEELLAIDRVTRVTAGGRQIRFRASLVIGDGKGRIGLGVGKAGEVQVAIEKAIRDAKKNLVTFQIVNGTISHEVQVEYKASSLHILPAHPGTGIIAGGAVRKIFAVSGVKDVIAKQHGAPNKITNARVTLKALSALKPTALVIKFGSQKAVVESKEDPTPKEVKASEAKTTPKEVKAEKVVKAAPAKKAPAKKKAE